MVSTSASGATTDNEALREIRDILKESRKQTLIMIILTIIITVTTFINLFLIFKF